MHAFLLLRMKPTWGLKNLRIKLNYRYKIFYFLTFLVIISIFIDFVKKVQFRIEINTFHLF